MFWRRIRAVGCLERRYLLFPLGKIVIGFGGGRRADRGDESENDERKKRVRFMQD